MKLGFNITCEPGVATASDYDPGMEFIVRYVCEAVLSAINTAGVQVSVTADGSQKSRSTRQNTRHLNLSVLCGQSEGRRGTLHIHPNSSKRNRVRAIKACAMLASNLGYEWAIKEADGDELEEIRHYKAFCWYFQPRFSHAEIKVGTSLVEAIEYAYDIQSTNLSRAV
jgi:hypothetical protein